jgi:hypothetical protein
MPNQIMSTHKADLLRATSMLSELPAEVGESFLAPLIKDVGWPFKTIEDDFGGTDWDRIMYPFSLRQFSELRWRRKSFFLDKHFLCPVSRADIGLVIRNQTEDVWAEIGRDSEPSRRSTAWHKASILSAGSLCAPVTLALAPEGIKILDGNHRIAALLDLGVQGSIYVNAWIGLPTAGT